MLPIHMAGVIPSRPTLMRTASLVPSARSSTQHRIGETYSVKFNPEHRWLYVPEMTVDEIRLLKCFDSKTDGRARFAPHTAFVDPTTPVDSAPRESIELRSLGFILNNVIGR